jgi:hypothetical protein
VTFPIWRDPGGRVQRDYRATAVPESFVIDRNGYIVKKVVGETDWASEANVQLINRLLGDPAGTAPDQEVTPTARIGERSAS